MKDTIWEKDKSIRTIPYKRTKMLTLSRQVTTKLQLKYSTEGNDKHKNHHLGTVSKKITGELKQIFTVSAFPFVLVIRNT